MKFCFTFEGKRFFECCSLEVIDSEIPEMQGADVVLSFVAIKPNKQKSFISYVNSDISQIYSVVKSNYLSLAYNY